MRRHLTFWTDVLETRARHRRPQIELSAFDHQAIAERLADTILPAHRSDVVRLVEDLTREHGRGYYTGLAMRLSADAGAVEMGDGGFTTWTAQLIMGNAKERCLVSYIATERLTDLAEHPEADDVG